MKFQTRAASEYAANHSIKEVLAFMDGYIACQKDEIAKLTQEIYQKNGMTESEKEEARRDHVAGDFIHGEN